MPLPVVEQSSTMCRPATQTLHDETDFTLSYNNVDAHLLLMIK